MGEPPSVDLTRRQAAVVAASAVTGAVLGVLATPTWPVGRSAALAIVLAALCAFLALGASVRHNLRPPPEPSCRVEPHTVRLLQEAGYTVELPPEHPEAIWRAVHGW